MAHGVFIRIQPSVVKLKCYNAVNIMNISQ